MEQEQEAIESSVAEHVEETEEAKEKLIESNGSFYTEAEWDSPIMRNAPTRKVIEEWKEKYGPVYMVPIGDTNFFLREMLRPEYKKITMQQMDGFEREELFVATCLLYPENYSLEVLKDKGAGIATTLSEVLLSKSGFLANATPIRV